MSVNVLIVDDSALMRKVLGNMVQEIDGLDLIDVARNGKDALKILERTKPDVITLDVEMPILNGIEALKEIKKSYNIPIIMLSSKSNEETTIQALELGAVDFIEKPVDIKSNWEVFKQDLEKRIKVHFVERKPLKVVTSPKRDRPFKESKLSKKNIEAIVIGSSTGGPKALLSVIRRLPKTMEVPVFIAQHMPAGFTTSFAKRLNTASDVEVMEAKEGQKIEPGKVYLAPGGKHMTVKQSIIHLDERPRIHGVRPAVDYLFETAAIEYGKKLVGVILTGMGNDGTEGCKFVKAAGGFVMTQDKETSVVYGMPRNAAEKGYSDKIASLTEIGQLLKDTVR